MDTMDGMDGGSMEQAEGAGDLRQNTRGYGCTGTSDLSLLSKR